MKRIDVVVVGAGPVGLLAVIELSLGGARVPVLERLADASTAMKAMGFGPLASEALERACIAWAGEGNSVDGLEEALRRWWLGDRRCICSSNMARYANKTEQIKQVPNDL